MTSLFTLVMHVHDDCNVIDASKNGKKVMTRFTTDPDLSSRIRGVRFLF
jgi:hypothetical protein